jgi:hypothetical protein
MVVNLLKNGLLPTGVHELTWKELNAEFAKNSNRQELLKGLIIGLEVLYHFGCKEICLGGSFVTSKPLPNDIDVCYDNSSMNLGKLKKSNPEFFDSKYGQKKLVEKFGCEFYSYNSFDRYIVDFFSFSRNGEPKGLVKINLDDVFDDKKRKTI